MQLRTDLPRYGWRTLHSHFVDWLIDSEPIVAESVMIRLKSQICFDHWLLAINEQNLLDCRIFVTEDDEVQVGIGVPKTSGDAWMLFLVPGSEVGIDLRWIEASSAYRLQEELDDILAEVTE